MVERLPQAKVGRKRDCGDDLGKARLRADGA